MNKNEYKYNENDDRNLFDEIHAFMNDKKNAKYLPHTPLSCEDVKKQLTVAFPTAEFIAIKDLLVNKQMQRNRQDCLKDKHIQEIMNKFDIRNFTPIYVNRYSNKNFVVEGQGRVMAFIAAYPQIEKLPCIVKEVFTWEEVCQAFNNIRSAKLKTPISSADDFWCRFHQGSEREKNIVKIFYENKLVYEPDKKGDAPSFSKGEIVSLEKNFSGNRSGEKELEVVRALCASAKGQYFKCTRTSQIFSIYYNLKVILDIVNEQIKKDYTLDDLFNKDMLPYNPSTSENKNKIDHVFQNKGMKKGPLNNSKRIQEFISLIQDAASKDPGVVSNPGLLKRIGKGKSPTVLERMYEVASERCKEIKDKIIHDKMNEVDVLQQCVD